MAGRIPSEMPSDGDTDTTEVTPGQGPPAIWGVADDLWEFIEAILAQLDPLAGTGRKRIDPRGDGPDHHPPAQRLPVYR